MALRTGIWPWDGNVAVGTRTWHWGQESGTRDRNVTLGMGLWHWGQEYGPGDGNVALGTEK